MLVKEYRILLPLSVDEYRIAQLYMIQKKSRVDTSGAGSGVEILKNDPYEDGPGGKGQYTYKVYHIGSHLPAWFRSILPKSALRVEEEAWNAYPYTRTRYTCPFVERFSLEVTTVYFNDPGTRENVFELKGSELSERIVDYMDFVKDPISVMDYCKEEDPKLFKSKKTSRGPLDEDWVERCVTEGTPVMCAYKLCRVEFRYWGMQTRIEKFIHDIALRKTMLRAHRQAWAWQDEWHGLTIEDIRDLEKQAQEHLNAKMQAALEAAGEEAGSAAPENTPPRSPVKETANKNLGDGGQLWGDAAAKNSPRGSLRSQESGVVHRDHLEAFRSDSDEESDGEYYDAAESLDYGGMEGFMAHRPNVVRWSSVEMLAIEEESAESPPLTPATLESDGALGSTSGSCPVTLLILVFHGGSVLDYSWASLGLSQESLSALPPSTPNVASKQSDLQTLSATLDAVLRTHYPQLWGRVAVRLVPCPSVGAEAINLLARLSPYGSEQLMESMGFGGSLEGCCHPSLVPLLAADSHSYDENVFLSIHKANQVFNNFLSSEEGQGFSGEVCLVGDALGGVIAYDALVRQRVSCLSRNPSQMSQRSDATDISVPIPENEPLMYNDAFSEDEKSPNVPPLANGHTTFFPQKISPRQNVPDSDIGAIAAPGVSEGPEQNPADLRRIGLGAAAPKTVASRHLSAPEGSGAVSPIPRRSMSSESDGVGLKGCRKGKLDFRVSSLFLLGSPLGLVLAHRRIARGPVGPEGTELGPPNPACGQVCNLYYAIDPSCARLEPLLCLPFSRLAPVNVPRYSRFPLGDGQSLHLLDCIQRHQEDLLSSLRQKEEQAETIGRQRSSLSASGDWDGTVGATLSAFQNITGKWWGARRVDFALYCPEGLASLPKVALPNLLHASFWESSDVAAFLIRQFVTGEDFTTGLDQSGNMVGGLSPAVQMFTPTGPTEKWTRKRTSFKIKNATANHRANDIIVTEFQPQALHARFMYGPLDVVALSGEKVDVYVKSESDSNEKSGEWVKFGTDSTDNHGRLTFVIPEDQQLAMGLYPVKMVVKGDHTYLDMFLAVVPPQTECIVFSIDGSFTASMSVTGKDPKVRPGAVDVVRHWQDLGYLVLYITARPDMQQRRVVSWLAQHNFPHGLLFFTDGISTDPLKQKTQYLKQLVDQRQMKVQAGYGSGKDIHVYSAAGVPASNIFVVGKVSKKLQSQCQVLADGYSVHLSLLASGGLQPVARPAEGNGRLIIRKGCFSLPGQYRTVTVQRSQSFTPRTGKYGTSQSAYNSVGPDMMRGVSVSGTKRRGISPFRMMSRTSSSKHKQPNDS